MLVAVVSSPSEGRLLLYHLCDLSPSLPPTFQIRDRWIARSHVVNLSRQQGVNRDTKLTDDDDETAANTTITKNVSRIPQSKHYG